MRGEPLPDGFPTSALAVLRFDGDWGDLDAGGARVEQVAVAGPVEPTAEDVPARDRRPTPRSETAVPRSWTGS